MANDPDKQPVLEPTEQPQASIVKQPGLRIATQTLRGPWKALSAAAKAAKVGMMLDSSSDLGFDSDMSKGRISTVQCVRLPGQLADYTVSTTERENIVIWGLDFMEIQKPIRTWHADKGGEEKPDLNKLRAWERMGENEATWKEYDDYVWDSGGGPNNPSKPNAKLEGATLTLAKMIREEGIESYAVYTPVLTKTSVTGDLSEFSDIGRDIGKIGAPDAGSAEGNMGSLAVATIIKNLGGEWLKTADRLQGAMDGTFQRIEIWTGAEKWNPNLYGKGNAS